MEDIEPPTERRCERCGRREVWEDDGRAWSVAVDDGSPAAGTPYCVHEWDVTGTYNPVASDG